MPPVFAPPPRPHCAQRDLCGAYCTHTLLSDDVSMTSPWIISGGDRTGTNSSPLKFGNDDVEMITVEILQSSHDIPQNENLTMSVYLLLFFVCVNLYCGLPSSWQKCHRTMDHTLHALLVEHVRHRFRRSQNPYLNIFRSTIYVMLPIISWKNSWWRPVLLPWAGAIRGSCS